MPFFIDGNPSPSEVSEAVNYLLSNFTQTTTSSVSTGQVTTPGGRVQGYLYRYLAVKYADSFDGTVNFTNTPTNRLYYGLRNTDTATPESSNPADYIWYQVTGGFGTTKLLFYSVTGGRQINVIAALAAPSTLWQSDTGTAIDLDIISGSDGASSRNCYAKSTSTSLASTPSTYQTTGNLSFPPTNTWGGGETWQATPPTLAVNEALFQSDGIFNPTTNLTTWNVPYLSNLKVGSLSAITANMGTLTAGEIVVGSSPTISGTTMTGAGTHLYSDGRFIMGNSTTNITFNGTTASINGFSVAANGSTTTVNFVTNPKVALTSFTLTTPATVTYGTGGYLTVQSSSASMDSILTDVKFTLENSGGTVIDSGFGGASARSANLAGSRFLQSGIVFNNTKNLSAGTYTLYIASNNLTVCDSTGFVISSPQTLPGFAWYVSGIYSNYHVLFV
jgi:hypothetical protein